MKEQIEKYLEEYNKLVSDLEESGDYSEFQDQIIQLEQRSVNIVDSISRTIDSLEEGIAVNKREIEYHQNLVKGIQEKKDQYKQLLIHLIQSTGYEFGRGTKRVFSSNFKFDVQKSFSVKDSLKIDDVPQAYRKYKVKDSLTIGEVEKIQKALGNQVKIEGTIDKTELNKYAKETHQEEKYLEEKPFLIIR